MLVYRGTCARVYVHSEKQMRFIRELHSLMVVTFLLFSIIIVFNKIVYFSGFIRCSILPHSILPNEDIKIICRPFYWNDFFLSRFKQKHKKALYKSAHRAHLWQTASKYNEIWIYLFINNNTSVLFIQCQGFACAVKWMKMNCCNWINIWVDQMNKGKISLTVHNETNKSREYSKALDPY